MTCPREGSPDKVDAIGSTRLADDVVAARRNLDPQAANVLLKTLHSCNEQLRQIQAAMLERSGSRFREEPSTLLHSTGLVFPDMSPERRGGQTATPVSVVRRLHDTELGCSSRGLVPVRLLDASSVRMPPPESVHRIQPDWRSSARGCEHIPVVPSSALSRTVAAPWKERQQQQQFPARCAAAPNVVYRYTVAGSPQKPRQCGQPLGSAWLAQAAQQQHQQRVLVSASQRRVATPCMPSSPPVWASPAVVAPGGRASGVSRRRASAPPVQWQARCA